MMKRTVLIAIIAAVLLVSAFGAAVLAQEEVSEQRDADHYISPLPTVLGNSRGIGLAFSFPLPLLPAPASSATLLFDTFFQGDIGENLISRTDIRFFLHFINGFRFDLTSIRQSFLVRFTGPIVVFAAGGGLGLFPIQGAPPGSADGFLLEMHLKSLLEIRVGFVGLFFDFTYEAMPQPFADVVSAGSLVTSAIEIGMGTVFHF